MGEGTGSGQGGATGILWAIIWFLLVIFIGWPIAGIVAEIYVFLLPFGACIEAVKGRKRRAAQGCAAAFHLR